MNTLGAFARSFDAGFGAELDVRDANGQLVVSHDPPADEAVSFAGVLKEFEVAGQPGALAVNVKADGLGPAIARACADHGVTEYFTFDHSVPDLMTYLAHGIPAFTRHSDVERSPVFYDESCGVWLDALRDGGWFSERVLTGHLDRGKQVCVVSPELHGRDYRGSWAAWSMWPAFLSGDVMVCTDCPRELAEVTL